MNKSEIIDMCIWLINRIDDETALKRIYAYLNHIFVKTPSKEDEEVL